MTIRRIRRAKGPDPKALNAAKVSDEFQEYTIKCFAEIGSKDPKVIGFAKIAFDKIAKEQQYDPDLLPTPREMAEEVRRKMVNISANRNMMNRSRGGIKPQINVL